jgi:VWFA-related protein
MRVLRHGCLLVLWIATLHSLGAAQQAPADSTTFKTGTDVILVPVIVHDSAGAPVSGLTKQDFTVLESGKPADINFFEEVHGAVGARSPTIAPGVFTNRYEGGAQPQRITVIVLDMVNTSFSDQAYARRQLLKFLSQNTDQQQPVALMAITNNGIRVLHDFTSDTATLILALKAVSGAVPVAPSVGSKVDRGLLLDSIKSVISGSDPYFGPESPKYKPMVEEAELLAAFQSAGDEEFAAGQRRNISVTLESMQYLAQAYAGIPGKKSLIWVTGGFPFNINKSGNLVSPTVFAQGTTAERRTREETTAGLLGELPESTKTVQDSTLKNLEPLFEETMRMLAASNFAVYPIDAVGLTSFFPGADSSTVNMSIAREERARHADTTATLETFAAMTGGTNCFNTNELVNCFRKASKDTESYYMVGYYRNQKNNKPGWRPLDVKVARPGLQVRARTGYWYSNDSPTANNSRQMDISLALTSPLAYTALPFTVRWQRTQEPAQKGKQPYKFIVSVPGDQISIDDKNHALNMEFVAAVTGPTGNREDQVAQHVTMGLKPEAVTQLRSDGLNYDNKLLLPPGKYTVHFVVRDNLTGRTGSVVTSVATD